MNCECVVQNFALKIQAIILSAVSCVCELPRLQKLLDKVIESFTDIEGITLVVVVGCFRAIVVLLLRYTDGAL